MTDYTAQELFEILNDSDECDWIEAKGISDSSRSIMETVCSFSNEPGLGGGYILMNISAEDAESLPVQYKVDPIPDPDKIQSNIATQCASMFNIPVRPKISIEKINGLTAFKIWIDELPPILYRLIDAINSDLPKGFLLPEDDLQATSTGLPVRVLREAIINALMHRSYREHRPTQIIRYDNRIEIINPGFSLKPAEKLGLPGSQTRNPFIAAVFHDTNLAETKGSGIRTIQKLMTEAHLAPPTFESSRENNEFISRLLLHHFLEAKDLEWLKLFEKFDLTDNQKKALIFVREVGAIDNASYRQITDCDITKASVDLRRLKWFEFLISKGKGKATYYIPGKSIGKLSTDLSAPPLEISTPPLEISASPLEIINRISALNKREHNISKIEAIIIDLCRIKPCKATDIARYFHKDEPYFKRKYLSKMIAEKKLKYLYPEMLNHPEQAYLTNKND